MPNNKINVLITRPENEGRRLATMLDELGIASQCQPMFDYQTNNNLKSNNSEALEQLFNKVNQPIIIFISVAAVTHANTLRIINSWPASKIFSIGAATTQALTALSIDSISPEIQTSEGLLTLPELQSIEGQDIIIVRGNGGREHLANTLRTRNGIVYYIEAYQRIWRQLPNNIEQYWRTHNINCMVITSDAILQSVVQLINLSDEYWRTNCYWVVVSERIAQNAKALGLTRVINSNSANNNAISNTITSDVIINME
jgi:uroporphyrinogen-III synthase